MLVQITSIRILSLNQGKGRIFDLALNYVTSEYSRAKHSKNGIMHGLFVDFETCKYKEKWNSYYWTDEPSVSRVLFVPCTLIVCS